MQKKWILMVACVALLTGCDKDNSQNNGPDPNAMLVSEVDQEEKIIDKKTYRVEGILMSNEPPHGPRVLLKTPLVLEKNIDGKRESLSYTHVSLGDDTLYNYLDRDLFYFSDPFILLKDTADVQVSLDLDMTRFNASEDLVGFETSQPLHFDKDAFSLVAINGDETFEDLSDQPYGFELETSTLDPNALIIGQMIGGLELKQIHYKKGQEIDIELKGNQRQTGQLIAGGLDDEMFFVFVSDVAFDKPIATTFKSGYHVKIESLSGRLHTSDSSLSDGAKAYILEGNSLNVALDVNGLHYSMRDESEGSVSIEADNLQVLDEDWISQPSQGGLDPGEIVEGQMLEGLEVTEINYEAGSSIRLQMEGNTSHIGQLTGYEEDMDGENIYYFQADTPFEEPIKYVFSSGFEGSIEAYSGDLTTNDFAFSEDLKTHIFGGNSIKVKLDISKFSHAMLDESSGVHALDVANLEILDPAWLVQEEAFIDPKTLVQGQMFEGLEITEVDYEEGSSIILQMEGNRQLTGQLTGFEEDMDGENVYYFTTDMAFEKPIQYKFNSGFEGQLEGYSATLTENDFGFSQALKAHIFAGNAVGVTLDIQKFRHAMLDESSGVHVMDVSNLELLESRWAGPVIENESLTSLSLEDFYVDYADYKTVLIPTIPSVNDGNLEKITVDFDGEWLFKFTCIGSFEDVEVGLKNGPDDQGTWQTVGTISNRLVEIKANLPTDFSAIYVRGRVLNGDGIYEDVAFTLDDMRDASAYEILFFAK